MSVLILIPARMGSTRLPGKPLADIAGVPMIVQVWRRAMEARLGEVAVAADSPQIVEAVEAAGGRAVLTRVDHPSGSDRIAEALDHLDPKGTHDVIVNVQGDLPTIDPAIIRGAVELLDDSAVDIGTLGAIIRSAHERTDENVVKIVGSEIAPRRLKAHYFTRATAPWGDGDLVHHIGLYAWRRSALKRFIALPPSPLELREKLEQLRALEAGMLIHAAIVDDVPLGVDTQNELDRAREMLGGSK